MIAEYIAQYEGVAAQRLRMMYETLRRALPQADEAMRYGMPTFRLKGKNLVHFAAAKHHIGFYPTPAAVVHFSDRLAGYRTSKGAIQFPYTEPLPLALIHDIAAWRCAAAMMEKVDSE